ncbi:MAG: TIGR03905 family TSCPD domain-containing protein [Bulleidia sp.]|nr:TIGR03905 family TSCPD domain-containing protein [Bulleidia sp.]MDY4809550.1 TIGR03905 family TSCPD domain-containing protein [Bulleidia sp.]HAW12883.1 TIGR03905 family protein [Erysipelotrichaceae bacterium]
MSTFEYTPKGVCSRKMIFDLDGDIIRSVEVIGGCNGNLKGISSLLKGQNVNEIISRLEGITCGPKSTSCPDQIAQALKAYKAQ